MSVTKAACDALDNQNNTLPPLPPGRLTCATWLLLMPDRRDERWPTSRACVPACGKGSTRQANSCCPMGDQKGEQLPRVVCWRLPARPRRAELPPMRGQKGEQLPSRMSSTCRRDHRGSMSLFVLYRAVRTPTQRSCREADP